MIELDNRRQLSGHSQYTQPEAKSFIFNKLKGKYLFCEDSGYTVEKIKETSILSSVVIKLSMYDEE